MKEMVPFLRQTKAQDQSWTWQVWEQKLNLCTLKEEAVISFEQMKMECCFLLSTVLIPKITEF